MNFDNFIKDYSDVVNSKCSNRYKFYEYIIPKLIQKNKPLYILETGTMHQGIENSQGAFTHVMANLIKNYTGGKLYTIDISEEHINLCKKHTAEFSDVIEYICSDSVEYLKNMTSDEISKLDLIYLDSMDLYIPNPEPSMRHHLNELLAVYYRLSDDCSIAIDDNYLPGTIIYWNWFNPDGTILRVENFETYGNIIGKGKFCNEFLLQQNGWKLHEELFERYSNNVFYYERENPKLKLVHILNKTDGEREINSINSLSKLKDFGVDYIQQITPLYEGDEYKTNKPITWRPDSPHNKGHYGNYLSFKQAIKDNFTDDLDALILCECDSILDIPHENFQNEIKKTLDFCKKHGIYQFSWGGRVIDNNIEVGEILKTDEEYPEYCIVGKIIMTHFIILTRESRDFYLRKIDSMAWDAADIWLNEIIFSGEHDGTFTGPGRQATVYKRLAYQHEGLSLLDGYIKGEIKGENAINHFYQNIEGWFDFETIYSRMVEQFDTNSHFVEIGPWMGKSTSYMAVEIIKSKKNIKFDCIDTWEGSKGNWDEKIYDDKKNNLSISLYDEFLKNIDSVRKYINPIKGSSFDVYKKYDDESIDFLFIDGAHDYESVKKDILNWLPKVKKNGIIAGHDYNTMFLGVIIAVNEIFGSSNIRRENFSWIVSKETYLNNLPNESITDKIINYNFDNNNGFVEIININSDVNYYKVHFLYNTEIVYETNLSINCWSQCNRETNCIKIYNDDVLIFEKYK